MSDPIFLDDGFTRTDTAPARPGLHGAAEFVFRPALAKERHAYSAKLDGRNAEAIDAHETDLIARHLVTVNGAAVPRDRVGRLHPILRTRLLDLILSFSPAAEAETAGKSSGA